MEKKKGLIPSIIFGLIILLSLLVLTFFIFRGEYILEMIKDGLTEDQPVSSWELSPTFTYENMTLHGTEGRFGIMKVNGESDEPEFPVSEGRLYHVYFLDSDEDFNGKRYKMEATHKDTGETVQLYEWDIDSKQSGAKFVLEKEELWKIDVSVGDEPYTSFIVEAK
jgi:hypothetical protein